MKRTIAWLLGLMLLLGAAGCAGADNPDAQEIPPAGQEAPVELILGYSHAYDRSAGNERLEKLQKTLDDAGYAIQLSLIEMEEYYDEAFFIEQLLARMEQGNVVAVVPPGAFYKLSETDALDQIDSYAREIAPKAFAQNEAQAKEADPAFETQAQGMPLVGGMRNVIGHTFVALRDEVAQAFGREVEGWDDYVEFLRFAKENFPQYTPGTMAVAYGSNSIAIYDLYLLGQGYAPLLTHGNIAFDPQGRAVMLEETEALAGFLEEAQGLKEAALFEFRPYDEARQPSSTEGYASVVMDSIFLSTSLTARKMLHLDALDFSEFTASVPSAGRVHWQVERGMDYLVMGAGDNPAAALNLFEAMTQDEALYAAVMLGEEGMDYEMGERGVTYLAPALSYGGWDKLTPFFSAEMDESLRPANRLGNYTQAAAQFTLAPPDETLLRYRAFHAQQGGAGISSPYSARIQYTWDIFAALGEDESAPLEGFLQGWQDIGADLDVVNGY